MIMKVQFVKFCFRLQGLIVLSKTLGYIDCWMLSLVNFHFFYFLTISCFLLSLVQCILFPISPEGIWCKDDVSCFGTRDVASLKHAMLTWFFSCLSCHGSLVASHVMSFWWSLYHCYFSHGIMPPTTECLLKMPWVKVPNFL